MRNGHFDDAAREYVIDTPATPLPWINYLGDEDFFSLISNTGGYSFYKDAKLRRITRYRYNNVPADTGARNYYVSVMSGSGEDARPVETFSPTFLPAKTPLDSYTCRHGIASTQMEDGSAWHQYQQLTKKGNADIGGSVFIGGMFVLYGGQYADALEHYGTTVGMGEDEAKAEAAAVREAVADMGEAVKTAGWDGEWFVRAYDAYSRPIGSHTDTEGQIFIEPQGMCVMAGIGLEDGKAQAALASVRERLTCEWGTAILAPAYSTYRIELGEISTYPRGYKENGGIFCHNNPWISIAAQASQPAS